MSRERNRRLPDPLIVNRNDWSPCEHNDGRPYVINYKLNLRQFKLKLCRRFRNVGQLFIQIQSFCGYVIFNTHIKESQLVY